MAGETVSLVSAFGLDPFIDEGFVKVSEPSGFCGASDTTSVGSRHHGGTE